MEKFIVITTINEMTEAIGAFAGLSDWKLVVVGDRKGPARIEDERLTFLDIEMQNKLGYKLAEVSPENHYSRKNFGYLYALSQGADVVAETDDDNFPYRNWGVEVGFRLEGADTARGIRYHNVYRDFTTAHIWPRGFPLPHVASGEIPGRARQDAAVGVWQGLADREPDVDAIYRLTVNRQVTFRKRKPVVLDAHVYCPFNSQNTFWCLDAVPFLFLPVTVSPRFTDILRGYVAQRLLWERSLRLVFGQASVYQDRNPHNLMRDFADELVMYQRVERVVELLESVRLQGSPLDWQVEVYRALAKESIVGEPEVRAAEAWAQDVRRLRPDLNPVG